MNMKCLYMLIHNKRIIKILFAIYACIIMISCSHWTQTQVIDDRHLNYTNGFCTLTWRAWKRKHTHESAYLAEYIKDLPTYTHTHKHSHSHTYAHTHRHQVRKIISMTHEYRPSAKLQIISVIKWWNTVNTHVIKLDPYNITCHRKYTA